MLPRPVKLSTLLALIRKRGPIGALGLFFVFGPLITLLPALLFMRNSLRAPHEAYDYNTIRRDGIPQLAIITGIKPLYNVTINGEHPRLISYSYKLAGQLQTDKFETMNIQQLGKLAENDSIFIKTLNGESTIPSLEPFSFPFDLFFLLPGVFILIGIPFLLIGVLPAIREYQLYKYGLLRSATLIGITTKPITYSAFNARQCYVVDYEYTGHAQTKLFGKSITDDLLVVNNKSFGDPIEIFISETDETKSCLVPRLEALKNNWQL